MKRENAKSKKAIINDDIKAEQVRLILADSSQKGVVSLDEAKQEAAEVKLDLVLISPDAEPPVCKIMDYGKHVFELKKQNAANRKKQKVIHVKEIKFRPGTEEGDYQVKLRNLIRFLNDGDRAKVTVRFRGRELAHQHIGMELIQRLKTDLIEHGTVDQETKMEGRQLTMVLTPVKKKQ
ncbi:MAG: translation initiation factor IF-3 [SAR86 cluster bacterium]|uniref:Translation initiation factor IF-3 n=1 Tax=SAR86 cluster bacterium TaxID=2030880 RepID=A0A2A5CC80_9GAMM|nr:translation initiation factor IF-3 [bacterium AH-315-I11]PCJ41412.1 MAG: translation initiation factor IF-3 [SAR86 cluster bacterium]